MGTLIHPRPFRVNQIALGRMIFQLGRPSAQLALTCNRLELPVPRQFSDTTPPLSPFFARRLRRTHRARRPRGTGSAQIRRSILPNSCRVRWLSANRNPQYRAGLTMRPSVLTRRCCTPLTDPTVDALRQHQPPPEVAQVVRRYAQSQPHFVGPKSATRQPCPMCRLFALFDPLFVGSPPAVEPHHSATRSTE